MGRVIAVDFDGTLCESAWPGIGPPRLEVIDTLIKSRKNGDRLILWTCREGKLLENALEWCRQYGLEFDSVNENLPERIAEFHSNPRKISADIYLDDHAVAPEKITTPKRRMTRLKSRHL